MSHESYVELHSHSHFSLLDGASPVEDLVGQASQLGMEALALTDHNALYGAVRFVSAAKAHGIRPILGTELTLANGHHLTLLVENETGWANLCFLITQARHNAEKGEAALPLSHLAGHLEGLIILSGCRQGEIPATLVREDRTAALRVASHYRDICPPGSFWIELQHHLLPQDKSLVEELVALARRLKIGYVATNNVHYATRDRHRLQDVMVCIRNQKRLDEASSLLRPNSEYYLKSGLEMTPLFAQYPQALTNTRLIAERCDFQLRYGVQDLPIFPTPEGMEAKTYLRQLCEKAIRKRYPDPPSRVRKQLAHELAIIEEAGLANYFLIIWDLMRFANTSAIRCQGRGSAANSIVAYLLGITAVDPLAHNLVFERFLSKEREIAPDVDIDFDAARREEVIQYMYRRYTPQHVAMACTFITYRQRSALRDVGKTLGLSPDGLYQAVQASGERSEVPSETIQPNSSSEMLLELAEQIRGAPRHLGIHNGGIVITLAPLSERVPTEPATMPDRVVVQWDKDALEDIGLVKVDVLGLRMLSAITEALEIIEHTTGKRIDSDELTFDDPRVYDLITRADTVGVFQVESRAQAQVLPQLKPNRFEDIVISISLIRPGPLQGNMVHPFLRRRSGTEAVTYPHPLLEKVLKETLGVILFQEDVLNVSHALAGFTKGQGEQLRRSLGSKHGTEAVERFRDAFLEGAQHQGVPNETAEVVFEKLTAFGGYSFPKSHAASFAVLVYQSAWLKHYYPAAFYTALLNNQPMGFWPPASIVRDAKQHEVDALPVDIFRSQSRCAIEGKAIRLGLQYVNGLGESGIARLIEARERRPFAGLYDFCKRTQLPRRLVERLIRVGAMDTWEIKRRSLLWELGKLQYHEEELDLIFSSEDVELPPLSRAEALAAEYAVLGLSSQDHVMDLYRPALKKRGILSSRDLEACQNGHLARVAGWVVIFQSPPTAKGFRFVTLEDEEGLMNVIVRPDVYIRYQSVLRGQSLLVVEGAVQRKDGVINVLASQVAPLPRFRDLSPRSLHR